MWNTAFDNNTYFRTCNVSMDLMLKDFFNLRDINRFLLVHIGHPIIFSGIITSIFTFLLVARNHQTFTSTRFALSCAAVNDIGFFFFNILIGVLNMIGTINVHILQLVPCLSPILRVQAQLDYNCLGQ